MKKWIAVFLVSMCSVVAQARQSTVTGVTFSNPTILNPTVVFASSGTAVLQISVFDGAKTTTATVTITVLPASVPPELTVGTGGTLAGTPTTFPVSLTVGTVPLAALQFDLTLPPLVTTNTVAANVTAGAAATAAGKTVTGNAVSATDYRVIVAGLNQNTIGAGVVANMNFQLDPSLPTGSLAVGITGVTGSDAGGNNVPMISLGGNINVTANAAPTVSAGPPQTITLPAQATLAGTASDDGAPNPPGALTYLWSVL
jgi:hypothetical protein